jgi:hypothetical protein
MEIRILLLLSWIMQLHVCTGDFSAAFLNAFMDEEMHVYPPKCLKRTQGDSIVEYVWLLLRALYGVRRSPQLFYRHLREMLSGLGFECMRACPVMYVRRGDQFKDWTIVVSHVDDLLIAGSEQNLEELFVQINKKMVLKKGSYIVESPTKYVGEMISRVDDGFMVWLEPSYYDEICAMLELQGGKAVTTPYTPDMKPNSVQDKEKWCQP